MDWTRIDADLVTDAARNGIPEAAAELARREQAAGVAGCPVCGFGFRSTNTSSLEKGECAKCGADWALHGKREQAQAAGNNALMTEAAQKIDELRAERDNARRVAVTMGNERSRLESILDDLQAECVRRSDTIHGLTAENARLRSLLDEAHTALSVEALANAHKQGMSYDDAVKKMCEIDLLKRIEEAV